MRYVDEFDSEGGGPDKSGALARGDEPLRGMEQTLTRNAGGRPIRAVTRGLRERK